MKILALDLENSFLIGGMWGLWNQNISLDQLFDNGKVLCYAAKWLDKKDTMFAKHDEAHFLSSIHALLDEADAVLTYNGKKHDIPMLNREFIKAGMTPPSPYKQIDLLETMKKAFKFPSNKLQHVSDELGIGQKLDHEGFELWIKVLRDDPKAWATMKKYNCLTPDHKVLHKNLEWKSLKDTRQGDTILGFDEHGPNRMYRDSVVEDIQFKPAEVYEVLLSSGKTFKVTADHKWLVARTRSRKGRTCQLRNYSWIETKDLLINKDCIPKLSDVWEEDLSKDAGWLAGFLDGEGNVFNGKSRNGGAAISFAQKEGAELEKAKRILGDLGVAYTQSSSEYGTGSLVVRKVDLRGSVFNRLKALGKIRPERLIQNVQFNRTGRLEARGDFDVVVGIKYLGVQEVAVMATSTRTFLCDGYPMHNCQDVKLLEKLYWKVQPWIVGHPNYNMYGTTGVCPKCGGKHLQKRGKYTTQTGVYTRLHCQDCGAWSRTRFTEVDKSVRETIYVGAAL